MKKKWKKTHQEQTGKRTTLLDKFIADMYAEYGCGKMSRKLLVLPKLKGSGPCDCLALVRPWKDETLHQQTRGKTQG